MHDLRVLGGGGVTWLLLLLIADWRSYTIRVKLVRLLSLCRDVQVCIGSVHLLQR